MITDGYHDGLTAALWALGALAGLTTAIGPWAAGAWLIHRTTRWATTTRPAWWIRGTLATRRLRREGGWSA